MKARLLGVAALALAASACAQARLHVRVDVYDGDPYLEELELERLRLVAAEIEEAAAFGIGALEAKIEVARGFFPAWKSYSLALDPKNDVHKVEEQLRTTGYVQAVEARIGRIRELSGAAQDEVGRFARIERPPMETGTAHLTARIGARTRLRHALERLRSEIRTPSAEELDFAEVLDGFAESEVSGDLKAASKDPSRSALVDAAKASLEELAHRIDSAAEAGAQLESRDSLRAVRPLDVELPEVAGAVSGVVSSEVDSEELREIARKLAAYEGHLDRLQDPADPAWRIIAAPDRECRWVPDFSVARTYAEGNTSTVIVRDRIGRFRVQRVNNNPSALIAGQARISRRIASGAIGILAAVTGVPLDKLVGKDGKPLEPGVALPASDPIAVADREQALADAARRSLLEELRRGRRTLQAADDAGWTAETARLRGVLEQTQRLLGPAQREPSPPPPSSGTRSGGDQGGGEEGGTPGGGAPPLEEEGSTPTPAEPERSTPGGAA